MAIYFFPTPISRLRGFFKARAFSRQENKHVWGWGLLSSMAPSKGSQRPHSLLSGNGDKERGTKTARDFEEWRPDCSVTIRLSIRGPRTPASPPQKNNDGL